MTARFLWDIKRTFFPTTVMAGSASRVGGADPLHKDEVTETQPPACEGQPNTDTAENHRHLG